MVKLYIYRNTYIPDTAEINRFMGFIKGFSELGVMINVYFITPDKIRSKVTFENDNVAINYLWENKHLSKNKYILYLQQITMIFSSLLTRKRGDNIILFGGFDLLFFFTIFKNLNIFHEMTEHPDVFITGNSLTKSVLFRMYYHGLKRLNGLFVISSSLRKFFVKKGVDDRKIHIINMTVDPTRFQGLQKDHNEEKYVAYCGSIYNSKDGVDDLIKAFAIVARKIENIKLLIIGNYVFKEDEVSNNSLITELGLMDKIIHTGSISSERIPSLLKNANVLVLARPNNLQAQNGFPTKLGEYLLTGNPVVVTSVGDISLFLKDGESAYIAEAGNIEEISYKIIHAATDVNARIIGKNGYEIALKNFNSNFEAQRIYQIILKENI